jgi:hypothetical protein
MQDAFEELVWRKGDERCERSYRENVSTVSTVPTEKKALEEFVEKNDEKVPLWNMGIQDARSFSQNGGVAYGVGGAAPPNKRETANAKINERYLIGQATQNPFMPNNNYMNDIEVQMNFLTPNKG